MSLEDVVKNVIILLALIFIIPTIIIAYKAIKK